MPNILTAQTLEAMEAPFAILSVACYALPVRFRVRGSTVECVVPTWCGVSDLLEKTGELTLVAVKNSETDLCWLFLRGKGTVIEDPDWEDLLPQQRERIEPGDLYQIVRIEPKRMELFDEQRGWGFRETVDF